MEDQSDFAFSLWLKAVDRALTACGAKYKVEDLDPDGLRLSFDRGDSPITFAKSGVFPLASVRHDTNSSRSGLRHSGSPFLPIGVGILVTLGALYGISRQVREVIGDRKARATHEFPITYPIQTPTGGYTPPAADASRRFTLDFVRQQALDPSSSEFRDLSAITEVSRDIFQTDGALRGKNDFGAVIEGRFSIQVRQTPPSYTTDFDPSKVKFTVIGLKLEASGQSSVWRQSVGADPGSIALRNNLRRPSKRLHFTTVQIRSVELYSRISQRITILGDDAWLTTGADRVEIAVNNVPRQSLPGRSPERPLPYVVRYVDAANVQHVREVYGSLNWNANGEGSVSFRVAAQDN